MISRTAREFLVAAYNRSQNKVKSIDGKTNSYKHCHQGGCFIGCALSEKEAERLPVISAAFLVRQSLLKVSNMGTSKGAIFLQKIQDIHDLSNPEDWDKSMRELAEEYSLMDLLQ